MPLSSEPSSPHLMWKSCHLEESTLQNGNHAICGVRFNPCGNNVLEKQKSKVSLHKQKFLNHLSAAAAGPEEVK